VVVRVQKTPAPGRMLVRCGFVAGWQKGQGKERERGIWRGADAVVASV